MLKKNWCIYRKCKHLFCWKVFLCLWKEKNLTLTKSVYKFKNSDYFSLVQYEHCVYDGYHCHNRLSTLRNCNATVNGSKTKKYCNKRFKLPYKTQSEQEQIQHIKWCFKSMACRLTTIGCWIHCNSSQTEYNWYVVYMYNTLDVDFTLYITVKLVYKDI